MITELRITDLGVIDGAILALHPGSHGRDRRDRGRQDDDRHRSRPAARRRGDPKAVRTGAHRAVVEGRFDQVSAETVRRVEDLGGELDDDEDDRRAAGGPAVTPSGRTRAYVGGAQVPVGGSRS